MNKNLKDAISFVLCVAAIAFCLSAFVYTMGGLNERSQVIDYQNNDNNGYYNGSNDDYVYFVYDEVPHLLVFDENSTYITYVWNNSSWIFTETKFEIPTTSDELIIPPLTWDDPTEE